MFHWICPECGREIPPSVRECQACDPNAVAPSVVEPVESAPVTAIPEPSPAVNVKPEPSPEPLLLPEPPLVDLKPEPLVEQVPVAETAPPLKASVEPPAEPLPVLEATSPTPEVESLPVAEPAPVSAQIPEPEVAEQLPLIEATSASEEQVAEASKVEVQTPEREVGEQLPLIEAPAVAKEPEPVAEASPVVDHTPDLEATQELPIVSGATFAIVEPAADHTPAPVVEAAPLAQEPLAETSPVSEQTPELEVLEQLPPVEAAAVAAEPVAEQLPSAEAAPVAAEPVEEATPAIDHMPEREVVQQLPVVEAAPVAADHLPIQEAAPVHVPVAAEEPAAALAEALPVVEAIPVAEPAPSVNLKPAVHESDEPGSKLHEVPDPFLALAEEIRAVQAARAAAIASPPQPAGLLGLAEAVGVQGQPEVSSAAPVSHVAESIAPEKTHSAETALAPAETATAVALLAPPHLEPARVAAPEPVVVPEPQPVALAPEPKPQPDEGPTLPLAPMQNYTPATSRSILPVPPRPQILSADSGPRITLPGPTLPPELSRLQDANVVTVIGEQTAQRTKEAIPPSKGKGAPGWLVSGVVMLVLLAAGLAVVFYLMPHTVADAKPAPTPAEAATVPAPAATSGSSPLAKFIEVTGFRIVVDANKKSEVQYLIVNHSDADISDANVFITLRGTKPGQAPVCRFSFKIPSLGPFESKEMSSPIEKSTRNFSPPEWQDLRADVQISQ